MERCCERERDSSISLSLSWAQARLRRGSSRWGAAMSRTTMSIRRHLLPSIQCVTIQFRHHHPLDPAIHSGQNTTPSTFLISLLQSMCHPTDNFGHMRVCVSQFMCCVLRVAFYVPRSVFHVFCFAFCVLRLCVVCLVSCFVFHALCVLT
jgi:hypothetical protein